MRLALLVLGSVLTVASAASADDDAQAPLAPAPTGTERFESAHHGFGVVHGVGGPLAGFGPRVSLDGFHYEEANGELADATFGALTRLFLPKARFDRCVDHVCSFFDTTFYLRRPFGEPAGAPASGFVMTFGFSFPLGDQSPRRVFQLGVAGSVLSARVGDTRLEDMRDALVLAMHWPLGRHASFHARADLNLYALFGSKFYPNVTKQSPLSFGVHVDLGSRLQATLDVTRGDIVRGGAGWQGGLDFRF